MKTICVDFDGVIHSYTSGWQGSKVIADPPVPGALEWLREMSGHYRLCIYSSRSRDEGAIDAMKAWFALHGMKPDELDYLSFPTEKPAAYLTIDDRCFRFEGDFPSSEWIDRFQPWTQWGRS